MLARLTLERFRGFQSMKVALKPITLVVGPNSSGKTSVLHAVRLASAALSLALDDPNNAPRIEDDHVNVCQDLVLRDHTKLMRAGEWEELFTSRSVAEGVEMLVSLDFDDSSTIQGIDVRLGYARNAVLKMSVDVRSKAISDTAAQFPPKSKYRQPAIRDGLLKVRPLAILVPAFYGVVLDEEYRSGAVVNRLLEGGEQSRIVRNLVARLKPAAFASLNTFIKRTVGAELISATPPSEIDRVEQLNVRFKDWDGPLELASAGAGLVNLIALYAAMERYREERSGGRSLIFLLDEPEAHLHPKLQGDLGVAMADLVGEFGAQLIMATHSIEMINRLGQRDDVALLHMDRAKAAAVPLTSEPEIIRELSAWCDLTPFASLSFLSSHKILFHEGPTDDDVLTRCAEVYFRSDDERLRRFRRWTFVALDGVSNADAANVLAKVLTPKIFPSLRPGEKVFIVRALDSDAERPREFSTLTPTPHIQETRVVWSRYSIESLFLDVECLVGWLSAVLVGSDVAEAQLRAYVVAAHDAADKDESLRDDAVVARARAYRRKSISADEATKKALTDVGANPVVWQNGRNRASFVLKHLRASLDANLQNRVSGTIPKLLQVAPVEKLGKLEVLVPEEIRTLLELMTRA